MKQAAGAVTWGMSGLVLSALVALLTVGCPGSEVRPDPVDAGEDTENELPENITVSGTAEIYPDALTYLTDRSLPVPQLAGLLLRVEEPLLVATEAEGAIFGEVRLTDEGTYSVPTVKPEVVTLGIAAGILDDETTDGGTPRVTRAATTLYDVALEGEKPDLDLAGTRAYALPVPFSEALEGAIGVAQIQAISGQMDLTQAGFILGKIVDETGAPVAGASLELLTNTNFASNLFYPSADFTTASQTATSANGLFVYVKTSGGTTDQFRFQVKDRPEYLVRNGGAAKEAALIITVYPGTTAP